MNLKEIRTQPEQININPGKMKKKWLIHTLKKAENNIVCYGSDQGVYCGEEDCPWKKDCDMSDGEE